MLFILNKLKYYLFYCFSLFIFFTFLFVLPDLTHASSCTQYSSTTPIPENFGAAYNLFSTQKEQLLKTDCTDTQVSAEIGNGQATQYIYKYGYLWKNSKWERIEFIPTGAAYSEWLVGKARITVTLNSEEMTKDNYLIAYICYWNGTTWKCGCRDQLCSNNYWQLQKFKYIPGTCTENWTCGNWSACANSSQTRICTDLNKCGTTASKPAESQNCGTICTENWICGEWGSCQNGSQTRICTDQNKCGTTVQKPTTSQSCSGTACQDSDGDFYDNCDLGISGSDSKAKDCNDNEKFSYPGGAETCDTIDNNCNGQTDEGCDDDKDGYCDKAMKIYRNNSMCTKTPYAEGTTGNDCDDTKNTINPEISEICENGIDENCNGEDAKCDCQENWTCTDWSICFSGSQNRLCKDNNNCIIIKNKPNEIQSCFSVAITNPSDGHKVVLDGLPINISALSSGGKAPYTYLWKKDNFVFGDNLEFQNLPPQILGVGKHIISVESSDSNGVKMNDFINIEVLPKGSLAIDVNAWQTEYVRDMGLNLMLNVSGGTAPYTYNWASDIEGSFSSEKFPNVNLSSWTLGNHKITVVVKDSLGVVGSSEINIKILDMLLNIMNPKNNQTFLFGENINFSAWAQGGNPPYMYKWASDIDGDITAGADDWFSKDKLSKGYHTITVSATDGSIKPKTVSKSFNISINPAPVLNSTINAPLNNSSVFQGDSLAFQASISGGVPPYTYKWNSNLDGQISINKDFEKNNLSLGSHIVSFECRDNSEQVVSNSINLIIKPPLGINVNIKSPSSNDIIYAGDSIVNFDSEISGGVSPYVYEWSSNINGVISNKASFYTTNLSSGSQIVTLKVIDQNNSTISKSISLNVKTEPNFNNIKNTTKYSAQETFLISNKNWQDVLSFVPVAIWNGNKYPMLTYHEETNNIDIDSAIHFMQLYKPSHLTTVGTMHYKVNPLLTGSLPLGANINVNNIANISPADYFSFWNTINSIVIVDLNNYQAGLIATLLASYKNAPIIFVDTTNLDIYKQLIRGKVIYSVGDLSAGVKDYIKNNASIAMDYDIEALQRWYISKTNTDKIILIDSKDFNNYNTPTMGGASFYTEKGGSITSLFNKLSLASPYLAAGKNELILFNDRKDLEKISNYFNVEPKYKTVMISHDLYNNSYNIDYSRIVGVTNTDTFSYVSRSLFYDHIFKQVYQSSFKKYSIDADLGCSPGSAWKVVDNYALYDFMFNLSDYSFGDLKNNQFIYYSSHGSQFGWSCGVFKGSGLNYNNIPSLDLSFGSAGSCLTGGYDSRRGVGAFAYNWLRMGGIAYWGAYREIGVGEIYYASKPYDYWESGLNPDINYIIKNVGGPFVMYGDPTLKPIYNGPKNSYLQPTLTVGDGKISGQRRIEVSGGKLVANFSCYVYDRDGDKVEQKIDFEGDGVYDQNILNNVLVYHTYTTGVYKPYCRAVDTSGTIVDTFVNITVNP